MNSYIKIALGVSLMTILSFCSVEGDSKKSIVDYSLFKETPIWALAKAIKRNDFKTAKSLVENEKFDLNYKEPQYGATLLMLAILNKQFRGVEFLLKLDADVNIHTSYNGTSAIIYASDLDNVDQEWKYLEVLLRYGANPNDLEVGPRQEANSTRLNPLLAACQDVFADSKPLRKVEILVQAGADVNYKNEFGDSPLKTAAIFDHYDVVLYLLEKGADVNTVFSSHENKKTYLTDQLLVSLYPLNSKQHLEKMKVIEFLENRGLKLNRKALPEYVVEQAKKLYPDNWQSYLEKY